MNCIVRFRSGSGNTALAALIPSTKERITDELIDLQSRIYG